MKKVIVLGANGQLGKTLQSLVSSEEDIYYFYSKKEIDITKPESLKMIFDSHEFDYCINCAAYTNVDGAEKDIDLAFAVNASAVKTIAHSCKENNVKLIHISTDYVFDGKKREPYTTEDKPNPINEYGKSKLEGENYIRKIFDEYFIIRTSWLYSIHGKNFLKTIIKKTNNNAALKITTEEFGSPTSCIDLSEFIIYIINTNKVPFGLYNFSGKGGTTWYGFAKEIIKLYDHRHLSKIEPVDKYKSYANRPKFSQLNLAKTKRLYKNISDWEISLNRVIFSITNIQK